MTESTLSLSAGTSLRDGRYSIEAVIGHGGFGITYRAVDTLLTRLVAIKEFFLAGSSRSGLSVRPPRNLQDAFVERKDRIREEARVLARFRHPNIVTVHEFFEENDTIYVVMELLEGRTLRDVLNQSDQPLPEQKALAYAREIASALDAVHAEGLLHRDVKPDNVMVLSDGHVALVDFGTAREFALGQSSPMSQTLTPGYAPVEQYTAHGRFGPGTDVYAFGATVYHMVTGQFPTPSLDRFAGHEMPSPREVNPAVSPAVSDAIMWAMAVDSTDRPESAGAFARALEGAVQGEGATITVAGDPLAELRSTEERGTTVDAGGGGGSDAAGGRRGKVGGSSGRPTRSTARMAALILVPAAIVVAVGFGLASLFSGSSTPTTVSPPPTSSVVTTVDPGTSTTSTTPTSVVPPTLPPAPPDWIVAEGSGITSTFSGPGFGYPPAFDLPAPETEVKLPGDMARVDGGIWIKISLGGDAIAWAPPGSIVPADASLLAKVELKPRTTLLGVAASVPGTWTAGDRAIPAFDGPGGGAFGELERIPAGTSGLEATGNTAYVNKRVWAELDGGRWIRSDRLSEESITLLLGADRGLGCADLAALPQFDFAAAVAYWAWEGQPAALDTDGDGIPCEEAFDQEEIDLLAELLRELAE